MSETLRLIPAHAGKTASYRPVPGGTTAHPRSRGENEMITGTRGASAGSSPLTRGKPTLIPADLPEGGLIPAHAGKTDCRLPRGSGGRAHPRSRGENARLSRIRGSLEGSGKTSSVVTF